MRMRRFESKPSHLSRHAITELLTLYPKYIAVAALREQRNIECKENAKGRQWRNHPEKDRVETSLTLKKQLTNNPFKPPNKQK